MKQKKKYIKIFIALVMSLMIFSGCNQSVTKNLGGSMTITLEPNQKLEEITWKDDSIWYLTRPMTENDIAETHTFQQQTDFGIFEGTLTIVETKE